MIWTLATIAVGLVVAVLAYALARSAAEGDRLMEEQWLKTGERAFRCTVCGSPTPYVDAKGDAYCRRHLGHPSVRRNAA